MDNMEIGIEFLVQKVDNKRYIRVAPFVRHSDNRTKETIKALIIGSVGMTLLMLIGSLYKH